MQALNRRSAFFNQHPFNASTLNSRILQTLKRKNPRDIDDGVLVSALTACKQLQKSSHSESTVVPREFSHIQHDTLSPDKVLKKFMDDETVRPWSRRAVLNSYFALDPKPRTADALKYFNMYVRSLNASITSQDLDLIYTPIRTALYRKEIMAAFGFVDAIDNQQSIPENYYWLTGLITLSHLALLFGNLYIGIIACGLSLATSFSGYRSISVAESVRWNSNVSLHERLTKRTQLALASRITTSYNEMVDINSSNYHIRAPHLDSGGTNASPSGHNELMDQLRTLKMKPLPNKDDIMYQEYWSTAGNGYKWVEPDQDPTDQWIK